jgi:hypothetical protein
MTVLELRTNFGDQSVCDEELGALLIEDVTSCELAGRLLDRLEDVLVKVLGEPNDLDNSDEWRFGNNGSLSVGLAGDKRGLWNSFEDDDAGGADVLGLLAWEWDLTDRAAVEERAEALLKDLPEEMRAAPRADGAVVDKKWSAEEAVENFWGQAGELSDDHGRAYLQGRGIDPGAISMSEAREAVHKSNKSSETNEFPAAIFPLTNGNSEITGIHAVRCPRGAKLEHVPKITNGSVKGAAIKFSGRRTLNDEIVLCEGPEDAMSIRQATGYETWASCSVTNMGNVEAPLDQKFVVFADWDPDKNSIADGTVVACEKLAEVGSCVRVTHGSPLAKDANAMLTSVFFIEDGVFSAHPQVNSFGDIGDDANADIGGAEIIERLEAGERVSGATMIKAQINDAVPLAEYRQDHEATSDDDDTEPVAKRRRLVTMQEMMAEMKPPDWLIDGHMESNSLALMFGEPKTGKSFVAVDMALSVAAGLSFHDNSVRQGAVVYVGAEGISGQRRRVMAWSVGHQIEDPGALPMLWAQRGEDFTDKGEVRTLATEITDFAEEAEVPIRLIVIDTLNRNFGGSDENNTQDMTKFVSNLDFLRAKYDATVLVVHHSGLSDKRNRLSVNRRNVCYCQRGLDLNTIGEWLCYLSSLRSLQQPIERPAANFCAVGKTLATQCMVRIIYCSSLSAPMMLKSRETERCPRKRKSWRKLHAEAVLWCSLACIMERVASRLSLMRLKTNGALGKRICGYPFQVGRYRTTLILLI